MRTLWLACLLSACASMPLYPARPPSATGAPPADPLPAKLVVHVTATAEGLKRALDQAVPASGTSTVNVGGERNVAWSRSPFALRFADGRIEVRTELSVELELPLLGKQTIPVLVSVQGEPVITSDWKARLQGARVKLESKDLRLRTAQGLGGAMELATLATESFIEGFSWDLDAQVKEAYQRLSSPITLPTGDAQACALLEVTAIEAGPTVFAGGFEKDFALVVKPRVSLPCGTAALPAEPPRLANVATLPSGPFTVVVPIAARYDELAKAMSLAFTDGKLFFSKDFPALFFEKPEVFATTSDQLVVKLHLSGPIQAAGVSTTLDGDLFFAGHPVVVDNELRIPDLEPTVETKSFLLALKASLDRDGMRNQAREALKLDLTERFAAVRARLSNDVPLEGALGCLRTDVAKLEVTGVFPHAAYLRVYVAVTAQAGLYLPCPASNRTPVSLR